MEGRMGMEGTGREDRKGVGGGWRQTGKGRARGEREEEGQNGRERRNGRTTGKGGPNPRQLCPTWPRLRPRPRPSPPRGLLGDVV